MYRIYDDLRQDLTALIAPSVAHLTIALRALRRISHVVVIDRSSSGYCVANCIHDPCLYHAPGRANATRHRFRIGPPMSDQDGAIDAKQRRRPNFRIVPVSANALERSSHEPGTRYVQHVGLDAAFEFPEQLLRHALSQLDGDIP